MIYEASEDSYLLLKHIKEYAKGDILDMGTGSVVLAIEASKYGEVLAVDINKEAVEIALAKGINAIESDLFSNVNGKFDLIMFNPPYLLQDDQEDDEIRQVTTGGEKGFEIIEKFLAEARTYLKDEGKILLVFSSLSGDVPEIIDKNGFSFDILEEKNLFFERLYCCLLL